MTYNYLATLRLHDKPDGRVLTVGPMRRVVFTHGLDRHADKQAVKAALAPLSGIWSSPENGFEKLAGQNVMSYQRFRIEAKKLLVSAGLLAINRRNDYQE